jgi:Rod binding domain-containing protein
MDMTPLPPMAPPTAGFASGTGRSVDAIENSKAHKVAEDFEAFFISMYLESMFSGVETDGPFGGGQAEGVYRSMLNQEVGKSIAKTGGIGIADNVLREIIKMQEAS